MEEEHADVLGEALVDYYMQGEAAPLILHTSYGTEEDMPVDWFFRDEEDFPVLEQQALALCRGRVLDIGAGAGSHALYLQEQGLEVTALESSPRAAWIMAQRGLKNVHCLPYQKFSGETFDTILLLMNGIGIAGNRSELPVFLQQMQELLRPGGQLLFDSSDITYLYEGKPLPEDRYYGEISFRFTYQNTQGSWFEWLYIDADTMGREAEKAGWRAEVLYKDQYDQYLMRLTPVS